jgi:hypothetical protein
MIILIDVRVIAAEPGGERNGSFRCKIYIMPQATEPKNCHHWCFRLLVSAQSDMSRLLLHQFAVNFSNILFFDPDRTEIRHRKCPFKIVEIGSTSPFRHAASRALQ